ncbi:MAG: hypothetical protein WKF41_02210 [Gaiellaceae bacterium]
MLDGISRRLMFVAMVDAPTVRQNVEDILVRLTAGGERDLAERLIHPDFVNQEPPPEA